jgi:rhamnulokinase
MPASRPRSFAKTRELENDDGKGSTVTGVVAAIDLGATSGRVVLGRVGANEIELKLITRFPNGPVERPNGLHWDIQRLYSSALEGLAAAAREEPNIRGIGVDSWGLDYGIIRGGTLAEEPFHHRDPRHVAAAAESEKLVSEAELYAADGIQRMVINTVYQLTADRLAGRLEPGDTLLLIPDLFNFWLTGTLQSERTNASTTGLLNVRTGEWDLDLMRRLQLPADLLAPLIRPGESSGRLSGDAAATVGTELDVTAVGSHDTASAIVAVPARSDDFAYISCGTWGLVGVELEAPVLTEASRLARFTNEGGVDGRIRYLHNVMGLWLLSESVREWEKDGEQIDLPQLLAAATAVTTAVPTFDANDDGFLAPGDMPARIADWLIAHGESVPASRAAFVRCIIESLSDAFARAVRQAVELSGKSVSVIHIVGGGSQNELLCQLTADCAGLPVVAGPVEATAIGNVLVQARALGLIHGDLETLRAIVVASSELKTYSPR